MVFVEKILTITRIEYGASISPYYCDGMIHHCHAFCVFCSALPPRSLRLRAEPARQHRSYVCLPAVPRHVRARWYLTPRWFCTANGDDERNETKSGLHHSAYGYVCSCTVYGLTRSDGRRRRVLRAPGEWLYAIYATVHDGVSSN